MEMIFAIRGQRCGRSMASAAVLTSVLVAEIFTRLRDSHTLPILVSNSLSVALVISTHEYHLS